MAQMTIKDLFNECVNKSIKIKELESEIKKLKKEYKDSNDMAIERLKEAHGVSSNERRKYFDLNKEHEELKHAFVEKVRQLFEVWTDRNTRVKHDFPTFFDRPESVDSTKELIRYDLMWVDLGGNTAIYKKRLTNEYTIKRIKDGRILHPYWDYKKSDSNKYNVWQAIDDYRTKGFDNEKDYFGIFEKTIKDEGFVVESKERD